MSAGVIYCDLKEYKTEGGLKRHKRKRHSDVVTKHFNLTILQELVKNAIDTCSQDEWLPDERRDSISKFACTLQEILVLFNNTNKICETFNEKRDAEFFFKFLCRYNCKSASFICKLSASVIINVNDAAR